MPKRQAGHGPWQGRDMAWKLACTPRLTLLAARVELGVGDEPEHLARVVAQGRQHHRRALLGRLLAAAGRAGQGQHRSRSLALHPDTSPARSLALHPDTSLARSLALRPDSSLALLHSTCLCYMPSRMCLTEPSLVPHSVLPCIGHLANCSRPNPPAFACLSPPPRPGPGPPRPARTSCPPAAAGAAACGPPGCRAQRW